MRLINELGTFLKEKITAIRADAEVYLFGSRADDQKKGGDINILILREIPMDWRERFSIERQFKLTFGDRKISLVSYSFSSEAPFKELALLHAILL